METMVFIVECRGGMFKERSRIVTMVLWNAGEVKFK